MLNEDPLGKRVKKTSIAWIIMFTLILELSGCTRSPLVWFQDKGKNGVSAVQSVGVQGSRSDEENKKEQDKKDTVKQEETASDDAPVPMNPPQPDPPQTPIRPFYELSGTPPMAPGLAMRNRVFSEEPSKVVYLTLDDGPSPNTPQILQILKNESIHATFFVIGRQVEKYPEYLKQEKAEGNAIGNHTYSHNYAEIYQSPQAYLANIKKNEDLIYSLVGIRPPIIRAPGGTQGHFHVSYYNTLDAAGYLVYDWNVSTGDAAAAVVPTDQLVRNVMSQVPGKDRVIMLMHDAPGKTTTVEALPRIIQYLKKEGYTFGILRPEVAPILFPGGFRS